MKDQNDRVMKFRRALRDLFNTEDGKIVAKFLQEVYVDVPAIDEKPELTYYRLGQKEFVQGLLKDAAQDLHDLEELMKGG